jgi:uncharacterized protein (DUF2141 family)
MQLFFVVKFIVKLKQQKMSSKLLLILPIVAVALLAFTQASITELTIEVDSIKNTSGKSIIVGVFDKSTFPAMGKAKYKKSIAANGNKVIITFDLPKGDYAVAVYQDINSNKILDKNLFGIPKEPYGFSKNFKPRMSPPDFTDCSFTISVPEKLNISSIH